MRGYVKKTISVLALCALFIQCACLPMTALAQETGNEGDNVFISNQIAIEDIAILAQEVEDVEEEVPEGAIRISVEWLPDDSRAPESVTAIIVGSGTIEKVVLSQEGQWRKTIAQPSSTIPFTYTLIDVTEDFTVDASESSVVFTVQLAEEQDGEAEGEELDGEMSDLVSDETDEEGVDAQRSVAIGANVSASQVLNYGDVITLYATLTGYEGVNYSLIWHCDRGYGFAPIEGANGLSFSFELTEENVAWVYQLEVILAE